MKKNIIQCQFSKNSSILNIALIYTDIIKYSNKAKKKNISHIQYLDFDFMTISPQQGEMIH
jgi:hypothetical protein